MSAYTVLNLDALTLFCDKVPHALVFFYDTNAADVYSIRRIMKPHFVLAKKLGYGCAQIDTKLFAPVCKKHDIRSSAGAVFFTNGKYTKHVEKIDSHVFEQASHKHNVMGELDSESPLPVYPMMKPDANDYPMLKPDAVDDPTSKYQFMKPDDTVQQSTPIYQKPNQVDDMSSEEFTQYRNHKALPKAPGQAAAPAPQAAAPQAAAPPKPQQSADIPVDNCGCVIL
ncbi:hypothetical protein IWW35_000457 [Coemansia sp. RSA 1878]|nr:hypothetical protein IWW35_000457 [Coemansia sp. RSA 1878]